MSLRQKAPLLLLALLPAAGGVLSAQEDRFEPRHESSDAGHVAEPHNVPDPSPPEPPPDTPSAPPEAPPDTPSESPSEAPPESPSDTPSPPGRHAVPVTELPEPHRQPPSRDRQPPVEPPSGGDGDGDGSTVPEEPPVESYETDESYEDSWWTWGSYLFGRLQDRRERLDFLGALDLDVSPGRTQIYLDGQYVGIVDQYDGWPSYLLLEQGTYELVFYLDGYRTLVRRVTVYPRTKLGVEDRLEPGPSVRPEDLDSGEMYEGGSPADRL